VVFSFFKKDPKDAKKPVPRRSANSPNGPRTGGGTTVQTRPTPKPVGRPLAGPVNRSLNQPSMPTTSFPLTENAIPEKDRHRTRALATAAKIDQIESEMTRDLMRGLGRATKAGAPAAATPAEQPAEPVAAPKKVEGPRTRGLRDDAEHIDLSGDIDAIEINTSGAGSVIDETAILFSNGQFDEAEAVLRSGMRGNDLGPSTRLAWHMLFELVNQRGDRSGFDKLTMDYAMRFEHPPPAWHEYAEATLPKLSPPKAPVAKPVAPAPVVATPAVAGPPGVRLPALADRNIVKDLEQLRGLSAAHASLQLDLSGVESVDVAGADLTLRVITAFKKSNRELILAGAQRLATLMRGALKDGPRDATDARWMLLLELLRVLGQQGEFEEASIDFCVAFEVSPPSWEPAPAHMKAAEATAAPAAAVTPGTPAVAATPPAADSLELRGVVEGEGEPHFGRLLAAARNRKDVSIDCTQLRRMAFSAGSSFLTVVRRLQQAGGTVELRNVNPLVAALLHLLGVTAIVTVQARSN
jgi:ABC-type transporter Mla MlaB component